MNRLTGAAKTAEGISEACQRFTVCTASAEKVYRYGNICVYKIKAIALPNPLVCGVEIDQGLVMHSCMVNVISGKCFTYQPI